MPSQTSMTGARQRPRLLHDQLVDLAVKGIAFASLVRRPDSGLGSTWLLHISHAMVPNLNMPSVCSTLPCETTYLHIGS